MYQNDISNSPLPESSERNAGKKGSPFRAIFQQGMGGGVAKKFAVYTKIISGGLGFAQRQGGRSVRFQDALRDPSPSKN